jgi:hypothetical protein
MARQGFLKGPLETRIEGYLAHIAPPLLEMVRAMQADVTASATRA